MLRPISPLLKIIGPVFFALYNTVGALLALPKVRKA